MDFKTSEKPTSRLRKNRLLEVGKTASNYNNNNYTEYSYISPSIYQREDGIDGEDGLMR